MKAIGNLFNFLATLFNTMDLMAKSVENLADVGHEETLLLSETSRLERKRRIADYEKQWGITLELTQQPQTIEA